MDGKIFEKEKDCLVHEFNLKGGSESFKSIVQEAVNEVKNITGLDIEIREASAKIDWDGDPNTDVKNFVEWQEIELVVYKDGVQRGEEYSRGSQGGFTKEFLVEQLVKEYHTPYLQVHEGDWFPEGYAIDGINVNDILRANYGKKIRIEILE